MPSGQEAPHRLSRTQTQLGIKEATESVSGAE